MSTIDTITAARLAESWGEPLDALPWSGDTLPDGDETLRIVRRGVDAYVVERFRYGTSEVALEGDRAELTRAQLPVRARALEVARVAAGQLNETPDRDPRTGRPWWHVYDALLEQFDDLVDHDAFPDSHYHRPGGTFIPFHGGVRCVFDDDRGEWVVHTIEGG